MVDETEKLLSASEASVELKVSAERCRRLVQAGTLEGRVIGGRYFVTKRSMEAWKAARQQSESAA
jgi:hypothetical protein